MSVAICSWDVPAPSRSYNQYCGMELFEVTVALCHKVMPVFSHIIWPDCDSLNKENQPYFGI